MTRIRALIVDDEPIARSLLRRMLGPEEDIEIVGECESGAEALEKIAEISVDLIFLDVQMPDMDGFEVVERIDAENLPRIVFVTAHDEFAVRAFDVHALDYLLKPFDDDRLRETLARVREHYDRAGSREVAEHLGRFLKEVSARRRPLKRIAVKRGKETTIVRLHDVDWMESESNYVRFHIGHDSFLARARLGSLEHRLDPAKFIRIHRQTIVNVDRIRNMRPWARGDLRLTLAGGTELNVSRRYKDRFERVVEQLD